jgi:four helix bundle protein
VKGINSHKDLEVYKQSMDLVTDVYSLTKAVPDEEKFGLISQMRRAAVSIVSNIAEGSARKNTKEYIQFLYI